jgi:hypothetical protein
VEHVLVAEALQLGAVVDPPLSQLLGLKANMLSPKTIKAASQKILVPYRISVLDLRKYF